MHPLPLATKNTPKSQKSSDSHIPPCSHTNIYPLLHSLQHNHVNIHTKISQTHTHTLTQTYKHTHKHTHKLTHKHTHSYTNTHTHSYTNTQTLLHKHTNTHTNT